MNWKCKYVYRRTWVVEEVDKLCHQHLSYSCTYYWKNPHLMKDFLSQYGKLRYYWTYSLEGQTELKRRTNENHSGLRGHSGNSSILIQELDDTFRSSKESKNFPYEFNPNTVCMGCKFYLK